MSGFWQHSLWLNLLIVAIIGYLLGSISFSIIITKIFKNSEDIRNHGSGNAGATNVMRSVGKKAAALTFLFDFLKCVISVVIGYFIFRNVEYAGISAGNLPTIGKYAAGICCVLGHIFPLYFGFKGGKGVVTSAAMIALLDWRVFLLTFLTFLIVFSIKKIISISSIIGMSMYPIYSFVIMCLFDYANSPLKTGGQASMQYIWMITAAAAVLSLIIVWVHRENIKRLLKGEEKPIVFRSSK
jgi:acyl-phosphate glycerol 3-phosphate acyltransferase